MERNEDKAAQKPLLIASLCPQTIVAADRQSDIKSEALLHSNSAWNGVPYRAYSKGVVELSVLRITIPPPSKMKWHTHPMLNAAHIASGEITIEQRGGNKKRHFVAGKAPETVNTLHRGITGEQPVVLVVFYAGEKGMPLAESNS
jgi:quercetin dioxygenase-like cupin family protein